jgi:hypothetical protein
VQFLANENISLDAVEAIRRIGHDVAWIRTDAPGSKNRVSLKPNLYGKVSQFPVAGSR